MKYCLRYVIYSHQSVSIENDTSLGGRVNDLMTTVYKPEYLKALQVTSVISVRGRKISDMRNIFHERPQMYRQT